MPRRPRRPRRCRLDAQDPSAHGSVEEEDGRGEALLAAGADAAAADAKGLTPLHLASIQADVPMMRRLLAVDGVNMDARTTAGYTPLLIGMCNRQVASVKFLLKAGAVMVAPPQVLLPHFFEVEDRSCTRRCGRATTK